MNSRAEMVSVLSSVQSAPSSASDRSDKYYTGTLPGSDLRLLAHFTLCACCRFLAFSARTDAGREGRHCSNLFILTETRVQARRSPLPAGHEAKGRGPDAVEDATIP
jgi:hypothetical protein